MGGGVMRAAAKAAALGGYRSAVSFGSRPAAGRRAPSPPLFANVPVASAAPEAAPISLLGGENGLGEAAMASQWPAWDPEDWELADLKGDEALDLMNPAPRLVFGPAPTMEEAKAATSDLTIALDKVYFSPTPKVHGKHDQGLDNFQTSIIPAMPRHVVQAFSLLQGSSEAQNVVASLAADNNVWDAVMKNEKVMEFCRNHHSSLVDLVGDNAAAGGYPNKGGDPSAEGPKSLQFADFVDNVKNKVSEMVNDISHFLEDFLGAPAEARTGASSRKAANDASTSHANALAGASFLALAVAVIMVVLVKRV